MDALAMIMAALSAGAIAAAHETAAQMVKDSYQGLKALVVKKLASQPNAARLVEEHVADPETWEKPLLKALKACGAAEDLLILRAAEQVMLNLRIEQLGTNKYNVQVNGSIQGAVVGDGARVTMRFGR